MLLRLIILLALACVVCRWAFGRWPWELLRPSSTRSQALFRARKLLGVEHGADREEIRAAHRRIIAMVHPDRGGSAAQVHEANAARDLLLSELPESSQVPFGRDEGDDQPPG